MKEIELNQTIFGVCPICREQIPITLEGKVKLPKACVINSTQLNVQAIHQKCMKKVDAEQKLQQKSDGSYIG